MSHETTNRHTQHQQLPFHTARSSHGPKVAPFVPAYAPTNIPPMGSLPSTRPFSSTSQHNKKAPKQAAPKKSSKKKQPRPVKAPITKPPAPTESYLARATTPPVRLQTPQRLLIILDLNGTLLYRGNKGGTGYTPRADLANFLAYCLKHHSLMIWSSATPRNVKELCSKIFRPEERTNLVAEWGRDKLGLSAREYGEKVQVYKRLSKVWEDEAIQKWCPSYTEFEGTIWGPGYREWRETVWGQHNTLLVDDSAEKARSEPWNLVRVPEFVKVKGGEDAEGVLAQVAGWIDEAKMWTDVSAFSASQGKNFALGKGWDWKWEEVEKVDEVGRIVESLEVQELSSGSSDSSESSEPSEFDGFTDSDSEGGVKLPRDRLGELESKPSMSH